MQSQLPVIIVGGGPTGLSAALFLASHGVKATLLERHADTSAHPKARALNPRTMELYHAVGIADRVQAGRSPISGNTDLVHVETLAGNERVRMPVASPEDLRRISSATWTFIDQNQLEPILRQRAVEVGADVRFHTRVDDVVPDADGMTVHATDLTTGTAQEFRCSYVIAADGGKSPLRDKLNVSAHGPGTITNLVSFFFEADLDDALRGRKIVAAYVNNPDVRGTIIPIDNDRRWVINVSFQPEAGQSADGFTEDRCVELVRAAVGQPELPLKIMSVDMPSWDISALVADAFSAGRVFFAGDAAHVMPPTGAFGASTGIQDSYNLAWKLALVLTGAAGSRLLDSYDAERRPVAEETVRQAMLRFAVREGRGLHDVAPDLRSEAAMTFGYCYPAGAFDAGHASATLVEDPDHPGGHPGARAPHVLLTGPDGPVSILDLFGDGFVLITDQPDDSGFWLAPRVAQRYGITLAAHAIGPGRQYTDHDGEFRRRYGLPEGGSVLVRPDGFVCWRSAGSTTVGADAVACLRQVLDRA
jgi:putative polyketide hydroxylase